MKAIVFVNGTIEEAVEAVAGVRAGIPPQALRAVVCAPQRQQFIAASGLLPRQVLIYSPWSWLVVFVRLLFFLGLNPGPQVACLATDHSGGMKLLALALRGRVSLRLPTGRMMQLTLGRFLWLTWLTWGRRPGDICLVGAAEAAQLRRILADLRRRHPQARIHGLLPAPAAGLRVDSRTPLGIRSLLAACGRRPRFAEVVIPLTGRGPLGWKLCALLLPLGFREVYNENNDSWPARDFRALLRHVSWRLRNACLDLVVLSRRLGWHLRNAGLDSIVLLRRLAWRLHDAGLDSIVLLRRLAWRLHDAGLDSIVLWRRVSSRAFWLDIPPGVTVLGSASPDRLAAIMRDVRRRHPAGCHGLLPKDLLPLAGLFDSVTPLALASPATWRALLALAFGRHRAGCLVLPYTGEGRRLMKVVVPLLPLGRREIYNENNDVYSARDLGLLFRHLRWRLAWRLHNAWLASMVLWRRVSSRAFWFDIPPGVTVLGAASPGRLAAIMGDVRRRHLAGCHGLLPKDLLPLAGLFDSVTPLALASPATWRALLALALGGHRAGYLVLPYTGEGYHLMKVVVALLPLGRREIYNENNDVYAARDLRLLLRHFRWRFGDALQERARRWRDWATLPPNRLTVVGSASGLHLKLIAAGLRRIHPGAPVHALLPRSLVVPAAHLFDSFTVLDVLSIKFWLKILSLSAGLRRSGYLVVPCTNEGYAGLKLLGFCLPLGRRRIYNENGDSCLVRQFPMIARHIGWRLHHRIFYQVWSERRGRPWPVHLLHLLLYSFRLLAGAALLLLVRWRGRPCGYRAPVPVEETPETEAVFSASHAPVSAGPISR